jgi:hypothetical protein
VAWHTDPFSLVDHSHRAKKERTRKGKKGGEFHHMKFRTYYDTKSNPAAKDKIPTPRG